MAGYIGETMVVTADKEIELRVTKRDRMLDDLMIG